MPQFTLHELACLDAVVREGSFQAAAQALGRTHPSVHAAVGSLERQLGVALLDRSQYRVTLTEHGRSLLTRARKVLDAASLLEQDASSLRQGEEAEFAITVGDLCPVEHTLAVISDFFRSCPGTRLSLHYGAIAGPWEALSQGAVDLIFHHAEMEELRFESLPLTVITLLPVVAPSMLPFAITPETGPREMSEFRQCVLRSSARDWPERSYHVLPGSPRCTVPDQAMKKALIVEGFAWGHMPRFMIEKELASGQLVSLAGQHFPVTEIELSAVRRAGEKHGPVAQRLWAHLQQHAQARGPRAL